MKLEKVEREDIEAALAGIGRCARAEPLPDGLRPEASALQSEEGFFPGPDRLAAAMVLVTGLLFSLMLRRMAASPWPAFDAVKIFLLMFSLAAGIACLGCPGRLVRLDHRLASGLHVPRLHARGPALEIVFLRLQGIYFYILAFLVCRL